MFQMLIDEQDTGKLSRTLGFVRPFAAGADRA